jgi:hypothetical protein
MTGVSIAIAVLLAVVLAVRIPRMVRAWRRADRQIASALQDFDSTVPARPATTAPKENHAA